MPSLNVDECERIAREWVENDHARIHNNALSLLKIKSVIISVK